MADLEILLQEYRNQIETIDKEILYLLSRRQNLSQSIWHIKQALWYDTIQVNRWNRVLQYIQEYSQEFWVDQEFSKELWETIHKYSLKNQDK